MDHKDVGAAVAEMLRVLGPHTAEDWTVLTRLFPAAPPGDPTQVLLWYTGRGELDGLPCQTSWR
jgi:hypothetical protein